MRHSEQPSLTQAVQAIRGLLEDEPAPRSLKQIQKELRRKHRWTEAQTVEAMREAIASGAAHSWPQYQNSPRYWHCNAERFLRDRMLEIAAETALTKKDLVSKAARVAHHSRAQAELMHKALVTEGELKRRRSLVGRSTLSYRSGAPQALLAALVQALREKLPRFGFNESDLVRVLSAGSEPGETPAARIADLPKQILERLRQLQTEPATPVTVHRLRAAFPGVSKTDFDKAALALAEQRCVYLTTHDHGWALPESEREHLVYGGDRNLYVAITLRE